MQRSLEQATVDRVESEGQCRKVRAQLDATKAGRGMKPNRIGRIKRNGIEPFNFGTEGI